MFELFFCGVEFKFNIKVERIAIQAILNGELVFQLGYLYRYEFR
jgi:hypothetical protein